MMEYLSREMYIGMTGLMTIALIAHSVLLPVKGERYGYFSWALQLFGWAAITLRFWHGLWHGDITISYAGAAGLVLLACGAIMQPSRFK
jgi:hypothetical protein